MILFGHMSGNTNKMIDAGKRAMQQDKTVMFVFKNQLDGLNILRQYFPDALIEIRFKGGLIVWERRY